MDQVSALLGSLAEGQPSSAGAVIAGLAATLVLLLVIAFTYQVTHEGPFYTQQFVHTLVLVGLVVSVVLRIVGTNLAAAFAIFGAFSIIRFRNTVPQTRDMGFIFFAMVVGLAAGTGDLILAAVTTVAVCAVMFAMWRFDLFAPERTTHMLRIRVTNELDYSTVFQPVFERHLDRARVERVETVQGGLLTEISYAVRLRQGATAHSFMTELQRAAGNNRIVLVSTGPEIPEA